MTRRMLYRLFVLLIISVACRPHPRTAEESSVLKRFYIQEIGSGNDPHEAEIHYVAYCPEFDGLSGDFGLVEACKKYIDTCRSERPLYSVVFVDCAKASEFRPDEPNLSAITNEKSVTCYIRRGEIERLTFRLGKSVKEIEVSADSLKEFENLAN